MRTLGLALAAAALAASAAAQQPPPPPPLPTAPPVFQGGVKPRHPFDDIDAAIKDLGKAVERMRACADGVIYLQKDLSASEGSLQAAFGKQIPSDQLSLLAIKRKRLDGQRKACDALAKETDQHFDLMMQALRGFVPPSDRGIPPRQRRVAEERARLNAAIKAMGPITKPSGGR